MRCPPARSSPAGWGQAGSDLLSGSVEVFDVEFAKSPPLAEIDDLRTRQRVGKLHRAKHRNEHLVTRCHAIRHPLNFTRPIRRRERLSPAGHIRRRSYRPLAMHRLPITFTLDDEPVESVTDLVCSGPYVLVLQTVMPGAGLAVELHSTFVGHTAVATHATHLLLGPIGHPPDVITREDPCVVDPVYRPDSCVYAHCHELIGLLAERGLDVKVDRLPERPVPLSR